MNVLHNQVVLPAITFVPIRLVLIHTKIVTMISSLHVPLTICSNVKTKAVLIHPTVVPQELLALILLWFFALTRLVLILNYNVDNLLNVKLASICAQTSPVL